MISRRQFGAMAAGMAFVSAASAASAKSEKAKLLKPEMGDDGLYVQPWFLNSFLVLKDDLAEAESAGKRFAIIWEQKGCNRPGVKAEVARMPGYFKPFHFINMFQYVREKAYTKQHFQKYIQAKAEEMRKQGKKVDIW